MAAAVRYLFRVFVTQKVTKGRISKKNQQIPLCQQLIISFILHNLYKNIFVFPLNIPPQNDGVIIAINSYNYMFNNTYTYYIICLYCKQTIFFD